jgi:hypothetical protein
MKVALSLALTVGTLLAACQKTADPAAEAALEGAFVAQIDPLRCTMPTTQALEIQPDGGGTYRIDYEFYWKTGYTLRGVTAERQGEQYRLRYQGQDIGQFGPDEVFDPHTFRRVPGRLLVLRWEGTPQDRLEFMGVKKGR